MRIFISYAHVDWQFVQNLARRLERYHEVWYDNRLHAGTDWWQTILEKLGWCEGFLYVLSPESLASNFCQNEYAEARKLHKVIVPARLQPNITLPDDLKKVQYIDFATRIFEDALADLIGDLSVLERQITRHPAPAASAPMPAAAATIDAVTTFRDAVNARASGDHEAALRLLNTLARAAPDFLPEQVAQLIADSTRQIEAQARQKEYLRLYQQAELLSLDPLTREDARKQWVKLRVDYPEIAHDPEGLEARLNASIDAAGWEPAPQTPPDPILDILPGPFEWCEIPGKKGFRLLTDEGDKGTFQIAPFYMAKYQTTFEQFQVFLDDPQGWKNDQWWQGLAADDDHRKVPGTQKFTHARNLPRENVSWYDAVAFCRWLSSRAGYEVRLPTEWEWQWAVVGDTGWDFPWGPEYIKGYANIDEPGEGPLESLIDAKLKVAGGTYLGKTTPVGSYPQGASPYGLLDMSGNVSEWCLNDYSDVAHVRLSGSNSRALRGGSWIDDQDDARAAKRYWFNSDSRGYSIGFRVCVPPPSPH